MLRVIYVIISITLVGCISTSRAFTDIADQPIKGKSIKVVHPNSSDVLISVIEQELMKREFVVISDNYLSGPAPTGEVVTVQTGDTTFTRPQFVSRSLRLFDEKPSDFILKYHYNPMGSARNELVLGSFHASIVERSSGQVVATFTYRQSFGIGRKSGWEVIGQMAFELQKALLIN